LLGFSDQTSVTAAGTTSGGATVLNALLTNIHTTSAAGATGVRLPASPSLTQPYIIRNKTASTANLLVYPPTGGAFNGGATDAAIQVAAGQALLAWPLSYSSGSALAWNVFQTSSTSGSAAPNGQTLLPMSSTGDNPAMVSTDGTDATPVNTEFYYAQLTIRGNCTVTGVGVMNGSVASGNIKVGLADSTGAIVATSASTAMSGTDTYQKVAFTSTYSAVGPATYYALLMVDNGTARVNTHTLGAFATGKVTGQVYATGFTAFTPATTFTTALGPIATLY